MKIEPSPSPKEMCTQTQTAMKSIKDEDSPMQTNSIDTDRGTLMCGKKDTLLFTQTETLVIPPELGLSNLGNITP